MRRHSIITKADVLRAVRILRWSTRFILVLYFGGRKRRVKALEKILPAMERDGLLLGDWHRGEKVYSIPRKRRMKPVSMEHEIACALILVLFWRCRMEESEIVPERAFRGFEIVPEGGLRYAERRGTMLVFEYCTRSNFKHGGVMKSKITRYLKNLPKMETKFKRAVTVLFVIDVERDTVREFVLRMNREFAGRGVLVADGMEERGVGSVADASASPDGDRFPFDPFFFIDFESLKSLPVGNALTANKFFWSDGSEWSLSKND